MQEYYLKANGDREQYHRLMEEFRAKAAIWNAEHPLDDECEAKTYSCGVVVNEPEEMNLDDVADIPRPPSRVEVDGDCILLHVYDDGNTYPINFDDVGNAGDIIKWVLHLCDKLWADADIIGGFVRAAVDHINGDI